MSAEKDLITIEEFRRRILARDRTKDALAHMVSRSTIEAKIAAGHMEVEHLNGRKWLDWEKYKNMPFRAYLGRPNPKPNPKRITTRGEVIAIYSQPIDKKAQQ